MTEGRHEDPRCSLLGASVVVAIVSLAAPEAQSLKPEAHKTWTPPRTPWGDPDIHGLFTTDDELGVPFERPEQFAGREAKVKRKKFIGRGAAGPAP